MTRLLSLLLWLSMAGAALAGTPGQDLLTVLAGGAPKTLAPSGMLNFSAGTYGGVCPTLATCISVSRAGSNATDLTWTAQAGASYTTYAANALRVKAGWGLLKEVSRTNYLLNSTAPATQTVTLPVGYFTLWVNGTGSATMSSGTATGCGLSVATQGFLAGGQITSAGTCVVTVSGSLNAFQLEFGAATYAAVASSPSFGTDPTSLIVTTSVAGTRANETVSAIGPLATVLAGNSGFIVENEMGVFTTNPFALDRNGTSDIFLSFGAPAPYNFNTTASNSAIRPSSPLVGGTFQTYNFPNYTRTSNAVAWGTSGVKSLVNDGSIVSTSNKFGSTAPNLAFGYISYLNVDNAFLTSFNFGNYTPSDVALKSGTNSWSPTFTRFMGTSITAGFNSSSPYYPGLTVVSFSGGNSAFPFINLGITGSTAAQWVANWATYAAPYNDSTIKKCVDFIELGTNDISSGAYTNAQIEANIASVWALSRSQGCLPIATTILPRGQSGVSAAVFETNRQAINLWIRSQSASYAALNDIGNDPTIGQPGQYSNTTYYNSDQTHPTYAGDHIIAADAFAAAAGILY